MKLMKLQMAMCRLQYFRHPHVSVGIKFLSSRYLVFLWIWICLWLYVSGLESTTDSITGNDKLTSKRLSDANVDLFECQDGDLTCLKDKDNFEAIQNLHRMLDDDHNGNVDQSESDEFLRDELQYTDGFERQRTFHGNDKQISVIDLWKTWRGSHVFNWTVDDVLEWLENHVELPQYIDIFVANGVDGSFLPRLACSNSSFFVNILGIKNSIHRQKLALKAMDIVLFGAPKKAHGYLTDVALVGSLVVALGGCWFAYVHHKYSQNHIKKMMKDLESLQKAEDALTELQEKLDMAEQRGMSHTMDYASLNGRSCDSMDGWDDQADSLKVAEEELAQLRATLKRTEMQLENQHNWTIPGELQAWLQLTHEVEHIHYLSKRKAAEKQMDTAKEECDKIRKRNRAFFGSLRMAHSSSLDDVDQWILHARAALEEVKLDLQERLHRWHAIENICNFPIMSNPGFTVLRQMLSKDNLGGVAGQSNSVPSLTHNYAVDDADEDIPPFPADYVTKVVVSKSVQQQKNSPHSGSSSSLSLPITNLRAKVLETRTFETPSPSNGVLFHLGDSSPSPPPPDLTSNDPSSSGSASSSNHVTTPMTTPVSSLPRNPPEGLRLNLMKDNGKHIPSIPYSASFHMINLSPSTSEGTGTGTSTSTSTGSTSLFGGKRSVSTSGLRRLVIDSQTSKDSTDDNDLDEQKIRKPKKKALLSKILKKVGNKPKSS
ncbi:stromal interaction molecule homolog isoform X2 [Gigantopelta aegis]|uniref:stromal interaction molecule homolog isoform X2 n=1 Tax=Gigantopelta aegis TaxID=1735272 RepID=UPI001B8879EE|nr:stromal interaction molecule homolog isoform X2 [Gigantopelta aegis]